MFNAAFLGSVAAHAKMKQDLKASKAAGSEPEEVTIQWPGSPVDGLRGTVVASVPGERIVLLASGRKVSVPVASIVAAPKTKEKKDDEKTDKTKKVVPDDKPDTRGDAAQEEDLTERAKEASKEIEKPPVLEHMKKGPKAVPLETARTAGEASDPLKILIEAAESAGEAVAKATAEATAAQKKVTDAKGDEAKKIKAIVDEMEKAGTVVAKIGERLVALDEKKNIAAVNMPKTGALRNKYEQALAALTALKDQVTAQSEVVKELEAEAEEQYGGTYNVQKRVSLFPASMQAALATVAGFSDLVDSLVDWAKGLFGLAEEAEAAVDGLDEALGEAGASEGQESAVAAAAAPESVHGPLAELSPAEEGEVAAFLDDHAEEALASLQREQQAEVTSGKPWDSGEAAATLFEFLSDKWADSHGLPDGSDDAAFEHGFEVFDVAFERVVQMAKDRGIIFETMKFPEIEASSDDAKEFIGGEIEHLIKDKGYEPDRAKGAAYSIARRKGYKVSRKPKASQGFVEFAAALEARTGLTAGDVGVDEAAFADKVAPQGAAAWISSFIADNRLHDLAPASK